MPNQKRKIAFIVEQCPFKGLYPFKRAMILSKLLDEESVFMFIKTNNPIILKQFEDSGITPVLFEKYEELVKALRNLELDLIIQDGRDSLIEQMELLRPLCKTMVHFDDFGSGNVLVDCNVLALFEELGSGELLPPNTLAGSYAFAVEEQLQEIAAERNTMIENDPPHIVIAFEDGDENNLTYRTLRHLTQLHIPLKISVAIDDEYKHPVSDLQMMLLSRRNGKIVQKSDALYELLHSADIVVCNNNYTPYKVAAVSIPCITLAQQEREIGHSFARELNGFIHLGLGRKIKQSSIQNAVMELLLHEHRRDRAIRKQRSLDILGNNEILQALLLDFAYGRHLAQL
ncbi:CMP-N-acetylneuraminic acid synthetase [Lysinibacillus sp. KU-BSD001]|uniref:PseG/SpsG family protein n=1 Tax=Lysinibacillus sp. KU-BSD001 TaxID=3141328 RepID=UPI0036E5C967